MMVRLCKTALVRLGPGAATLLGELREREHTPIVQDCLDRCTVCELGKLVFVADGMPLAAADAATLLGMLDELGD